MDGIGIDRHAASEPERRLSYVFLCRVYSLRARRRRRDCRCRVPDSALPLHTISVRCTCKTDRDRLRNKLFMLEIAARLPCPPGPFEVYRNIRSNGDGDCRACALARGRVALRDSYRAPRSTCRQRRSPLHSPDDELHLHRIRQHRRDRRCGTLERGCLWHGPWVIHFGAQHMQIASPASRGVASED